MVRELSKHQSVSCLIVAFVIARFASLSCYSSVKTRIRPVKLYQINEFFCSITHCVSLHLVYRLIAVLKLFWCLELQVCLLCSPCYYFFEPKLEPDPAFESHFQFFNCVSVRNISVLTLQTCKSVQVPFNVCKFCKLFNKFDQPYYSPTAVS